MDCAVEPDGVAVTLKVYVPVVVPAFDVPPPPPPPVVFDPQPATNPVDRTSNTARGANFNFRPPASNTRKKQRSAIAASGMAHRMFDGPSGDRKTILDAAVDEQVIVALPIDDADKEIVLGGVKFKLGDPKLHAGTSTAPAGELIPVELNAAVPVKPFAPPTMIEQDPDWPGAVIVMTPVQPEEILTPGVPTAMVTEAEMALAA